MNFTGQPKNINEIYTPTILRLTEEADKQCFNSIKEEAVFISNEIKGQLSELIKSRTPSKKIQPQEYDAAILQHLNGIEIDDYGVWVYYPWSKRLVHLLDETEFIEVRTNRNQYKITRQERDFLSSKKIGIIGLSVGQSIALTLAMERSCGELRLADFDMLELSNLNRIRTGIHNLGIHKVVIAAREIAEIDPFIKVKCFFDGMTESNMEDFFNAGGKLDILVDECDGLDIKILARYKARELGIPVIMDTSDRGMLDIERFDLEPERPILHGMAAGLNPSNIKEISNEDKVPIVLQMLGVDNISVRAKASMVEVEQSINTWPQLASSVTLGGAAGADTCRRILLDQLHISGRFYVDFEEIIKEEQTKNQYSRVNSTTGLVSRTRDANPFSALLPEEMIGLAETYYITEPLSGETILSADQVQELVAAACAAPSTGNDQPWRWLYHKGTLCLFHDQFRSFSFGDFQNTASYISFGAAYENLYIHALKMGFKTHLNLADKKDHPLVASIRFSPLTGSRSTEDLLLEPLDNYIHRRITNRIQHPKAPLPEDIYEKLRTLGQTIAGANVHFFTDIPSIQTLGEIIGFCDRVRLLDVNGHFDFVHREMRWDPEQSVQTSDGIDVRTLGLSSAQLAALNVIKNEQVIQMLNAIDGGKAIESLAHRTVSTASALCLITFPGLGLDSYFEGGRAMERLWLSATGLDLAIHPLISPLYLFARLINGGGEGLDPKFLSELSRLQQKFREITGMQDTDAGVFLAKIAIAPEPELKSLRLPLEETLILA